MPIIRHVTMLICGNLTIFPVQEEVVVLTVVQLNWLQDTEDASRLSRWRIQGWTPGSSVPVTMCRGRRPTGGLCFFHHLALTWVVTDVIRS